MSVLKFAFFIVALLYTTAAFNQTKRITFQSPLLYPEGTAYNLAKKVYYVSSVTKATIGSVLANGKYSVIYDDSSLKSTYGMKVDSATQILWVCAGDANYSQYTDSSTYKKMIRLIGIDLNTNKKVADVNLSDLFNGKHFANDITIDKNGNKYITDSYSPVIYKVDAQNNASILTQSELFKSADIGLNGIAWHPDGYLITVNNSTGALLKVDLKSPSNVTVVKAGQFFIGGDGLIFDAQNNLYVVQNKSINKATKLNSTDGWTTAKIVGTTATTDRFQNPSTCTFSNNELYLLNSKLNELSDPTIKPSTEFSLQLAEFRQ